MKGSWNSSMPLINTILTILNFFPIQKIFNYKNLMRKIIVYSFFFLFSISSYVFGCISLYYYLVDYWGEVLAALSLCLFSLIISFSLLTIDKLLKSKKNKPSHLLFSHLEEGLNQIPNTQKLVKTLKKTSPKVLITVLGAVALATYIIVPKKKNNKTD